MGRFKNLFGNNFKITIVKNHTHALYLDSPILKIFFPICYLSRCNVIHVFFLTEHAFDNKLHMS